MDQGWAAIVAATVGLVGALGGALAGGYAAIRGAREGAERAAQAALAQAARQARDQYEHWLRQERRATYAETLKDIDEHQMKASELLSYVEHPEGDASCLQAMEAFQLSQIGIIRGIGPVMTIAGLSVREAYKDYVEAGRQMSIYLMGRRPSEIGTDELRQHYRSLTVHEGRLTVAVATDIQTGPLTPPRE